MRSWDSEGRSDGLSQFNRALDSVNLRESPLRHAQRTIFWAILGLVKLTVEISCQVQSR